MSKFIGYTVGLETSAGFAKAEYNSASDGVEITAVSARNLGRIKSAGTAVVSKDEFDNRPTDPYDSIAEARWAFEKLGVEIG